MWKNVRKFVRNVEDYWGQYFEDLVAIRCRERPSPPIYLTLAPRGVNAKCRVKLTLAHQEVAFSGGDHLWIACRSSGHCDIFKYSCWGKGPLFRPVCGIWLPFMTVGGPQGRRVIYPCNGGQKIKIFNITIYRDTALVKLVAGIPKPAAFSRRIAAGSGTVWNVYHQIR